MTTNLRETTLLAGHAADLVAADGHSLRAYMTGPASAEKGLVVLQEIFGVNHHIRHVCDMFAVEGYAVIAPCLFDRVERGVELHYGAEDVARGRRLRSCIDAGDTMLDIEAASEALGVPGPGLIGYCWGGTLAWLAASRLHRFAAAVGWYGAGIADARQEMPHCPVQLHFGALDTGIPLSDVAAISRVHPEIELFTYADAGHGFGCAARESYVPEAAALAQERTLDFFRKYL